MDNGGGEEVAVRPPGSEARGPGLPGHDDARMRERALRLAAVLVGVSSLLGLLSRYFGGTGSPQSTGVGLTVVLACVATLGLIGRGRIVAASWLFLVVAWAMVGGISITRGGLYAGTIGLYLLVTVIAGVVLSARAAVVACALSIAGSLGLLALEASGSLAAGVGMTIAQRGLTATLTLSATTAIFLVALRQLQAALSEASAARVELTQANQQLRTAHAGLEETVRQRTQSLMEARDQALAAARSKMSFLANMSHELRTPMNAIIGVTELLKARRLEPEAAEFVELMADSADALVTLLDDVLDLAKIEAGRLVVERAPWEVRTAVNEVVALMTPQARTRGLELHAFVDDAVPARVVGDRARVRQILLNFLDNALKFTERGSVQVSVTVEAEACLRFAVTDTGAGLTPGDQERLFKPFEQLDASSTRRHGGTGLGLAISKQLAQLMEGEVGVTSRPGAGSTFWFTIRAPDAAGAPVSGDFKPVAPPDGGPLPSRVLVVEDNPANQRIARTLLEELRCAVEVVDSGQAALDACAREPFEVVLMDIMMPGLDGRETTRRLRARPGRQPWIIAVTASALPEDRRACFDAGVDDFLSKPVKLDELRRGLARAAAEAPRRGLA